MANRMKDTTSMIVRPLKNEEDYEAALERIETLVDGKDEGPGEGELALLENLVEEYETREAEESDDEESDVLDDYELMSRFPEAETLALANFKLSNGNEV